MKIVRQISTTLGKDLVISTEPAAGNDVAKGGQVTIVVSDGLSRVQVPNIVGMLRADALDALAQVNLVLAGDVVMEVGLPESQQYVVDVSPPVGTEVDALTSVDITFGSYADFQYSLTPTAAQTLSPTPGPTATPAPTPTPVPTTPAATATPTP